MIRTLLTVALLLFTVCCFSQDTTNLSNWRSLSLPDNPDTLSLYNWSPDNWIVCKIRKQVHAFHEELITDSDNLPFIIQPLDRMEQEKMKGKRSVQRVDDGYLIGFWRGEWGGCLYWFARDGQARYQVSRHMVLQFLERDGGIYAIAGLAHLGMSQGNIVEIKKVNNKWTADNWLVLPFAPYAATSDTKGNFIVITSGNLLRVRPDKKTDTLISKGFWEGLYPTSILVKDNIAYAGMRKGVLRYRFASGKAEWLLPGK